MYIVCMKYLGVDVGSKQVGVAVSDDGGSVAFPVGQTDLSSAEDYILQLIRERKVSVVVIGESLNLDGSENPVMRDAHTLAKALGLHVRVVFEPEQFSTQAAGRLGKGSDAEAATLILQSHLDRQRSGDEDIMFA